MVLDSRNTLCQGFVRLLTLWMMILSMLASPERASAESLVELWESVIANNPVLRTSEHTVEQARAQQDQALAGLLPNAAIKGYYSYNSLNNSVNAAGFNLFGSANKQYAGYNGNMTISQVLFDLPSYFRHQGAIKQTEQQEQSALSQRMEIAYRMVDRYLAILEAEDLTAQLEVESKASEAQADRLRHMNESQLAKVTDLYETEAYCQSLKSSIIEAKHQREIAGEELREITGVAVQAPDVLVAEEFPDIHQSADEWVDEAMSSNPMLLSLQYAADSAQQLIQGARAGHLPTANMSASETLSNTIYNNLQTDGLDSYNIGTLYLNVTIPVYSGGGVEAGVRESVQRYQISRSKIDEVRRTVEKDIRTSWFNIESGKSKIDSTRKEVRFREQARLAQETSYRLGASTIVDVLDAHKKLLKAMTDFQKARYEYVRNLMRLRLHSGSLADLDLEAISAWFQPKQSINTQDQLGGNPYLSRQSFDATPQ